MASNRVFDVAANKGSGNETSPLLNLRKDYHKDEDSHQKSLSIGHVLAPNFEDGEHRWGINLTRRIFGSFSSI